MRIRFPATEHMARMAERISLHQVAAKQEKVQPMEMCLFLTSPL
jgi:hypothetical protein